MTSQAAAASLLDTPKIADTPEMPRTIEATGIAVDQIEQLLIKTLYQGEAIGTAVADRMRLTFGILEPLIERARAERLMEVRGARALDERLEDAERRSEEHTSELQSRFDLVCRLLLEKKK